MDIYKCIKVFVRLSDCGDQHNKECCHIKLWFSYELCIHSFENKVHYVVPVAGIHFSLKTCNLFRIVAFVLKLHFYYYYVTLILFIIADCWNDEMKMGLKYLCTAMNEDCSSTILENWQPITKIYTYLVEGLGYEIYTSTEVSV